MEVAATEAPEELVAGTETRTERLSGLVEYRGRRLTSIRERTE
jgi:hypothetical protein